MATGPGPDQWMDDPRNWSEMDRLDEEYAQDVQLGPWWKSALWLLFGAFVMLILIPLVFIEDVITTIKDSTHRTSDRAEDA